MPGIPPTSAIASQALLTSTNCHGHVHLVVGCNPLAAARVQKSREAGAVVRLVAPEGEELPYGLQRRIEEGEIEWVRRGFEMADLETLGREEVGGVVDLVWITSEVRGDGEFIPTPNGACGLTHIQPSVSRPAVVACVFPSMSSTYQSYAPSHC